MLGSGRGRWAVFQKPFKIDPKNCHAKRINWGYSVTDRPPLPWVKRCPPLTPDPSNEPTSDGVINRVRRKWKRSHSPNSDSVVLMTHKRCYDSAHDPDSDSDSDSVASENQPSGRDLEFTFGTKAHIAALSDRVKSRSQCQIHRFSLLLFFITDSILNVFRLENYFS